MTGSKRVTVGSRMSPLSIAQTEEILVPLRLLHPEIEFVFVPITTDGDRHKNAPLLSMPRGMFAKEIELALLNGEIDFAVHSAKDLPASLPDGLMIAAIGQRQDPRDVLVNRWGLPYMKIPPSARVGTSSPRRIGQLKALRPDIEFVPVRGNVGTRLEKVISNECDGVVLAAAGLVRLGRQDKITEYLSSEICIPEVGQGALAVEARASDLETIEMLAGIDHKPSSISIASERAFLLAIGGGCRVPVTAYARLIQNQLHISAMATVPNGMRLFRVQTTHDAGDPVFAGRCAADALFEAGAAEIIISGAEQ